MEKREGELKMLKRVKSQGGGEYWSVQRTIPKKVVLELTAYNSAGPTSVENRPKLDDHGGVLRWEKAHSLETSTPLVPGTSTGAHRCPPNPGNFEYFWAFGECRYRFNSKILLSMIDRWLFAYMSDAISILTKSYIVYSTLHVS